MDKEYDRAYIEARLRELKKKLETRSSDYAKNIKEFMFLRNKKAQLGKKENVDTIKNNKE